MSDKLTEESPVFPDADSLVSYMDAMFPLGLALTLGISEKTGEVSLTSNVKGTSEWFAVSFGCKLTPGKPKENLLTLSDMFAMASQSLRLCIQDENVFPEETPCPTT